MAETRRFRASIAVALVATLLIGGAAIWRAGAGSPSDDEIGERAADVDEGRGTPEARRADAPVHELVDATSESPDPAVAPAVFPADDAEGVIIELVDATGAPLSGGRLYLRRAERTTRHEIDEQGRARIGTASGRATLAIAHPDRLAVFARDVELLPLTRVAFDLATRLEGVVRVEGGPPPRPVPLHFGSSRPSWWPRDDWGLTPAETEDLFQKTFASGEAGKVAILGERGASVEGYLIPRGGFVLRVRPFEGLEVQSDERFELDLAVGRTIEGQVLESDSGEPVARARVKLGWFQDPRLPSIKRGLRERTDAKGRFTFTTPLIEANEPLNLEVHQGAREVRRAFPAELFDRLHVVLGTILLEPAERCVLRVLAPNGAPIAGAIAVTAGDSETVEGPSDADGRLTFAIPTQGSSRISILAKGHRHETLSFADGDLGPSEVVLSPCADVFLESEGPIELLASARMGVFPAHDSSIPASIWFDFYPRSDFSQDHPKEGSRFGFRSSDDRVELSGLAVPSRLVLERQGAAGAERALLRVREPGRQSVALSSLVWRSAAEVPDLFPE